MLHKNKSPYTNPQKAQDKNKSPYTNPQKGSTSSTPQASPPHELRKGRAALPRDPFAIRGAWGDEFPHTKKLYA